MYQPKVKFVLQYKNKHFSFDAYSSSGSSQFTATLQLAASVGITHPPHSHRKLSLRENLPLKDFIGNMEVLSVSKPAGIVKKSSQSDVISGGLVPPWCAIKGSTRRSEAAVLSSDGTSWMFDEHFWWIKTFQEKKLPVNDDRCYYVPTFFVSFLLVCFMVLSKCFA